MAIVKTKPTSPGRRFAVKIRGAELHKGQPFEALVDKKTRSGGRNNQGRITTRHRGGGHKQRYRIIDFKRDKAGVPGVVERLEYDPNRTAHIALVKYSDGERRYMIAPKGLKAGDRVQSSLTHFVGDCVTQHHVVALHERSGVDRCEFQVDRLPRGKGAFFLPDGNVQDTEGEQGAEPDDDGFH